MKRSRRVREKSVRAVILTKEEVLRISMGHDVARNFIMPNGCMCGVIGESGYGEWKRN